MTEDAIIAAVDVSNLTLAVARAKEFSPLMSAVAIATMAATVVAEDEAACIALARELVKIAAELDPHAVNAKWDQ